MGSGGSAKATPAASPSPAESPSPSPSPLPCAQPAARPRAAGVASADPVLLLASGLNSPDDLWYSDADGSVLVGEHGDGHISLLTAGGALSRLPQVVLEVEGIAQIGGTTYVADQFHARVVALTGTGVRTVLQLLPVPTGENLDGITADKDLLIVPDSPHGTLLVVDTSGHVLRRVAGFSRPAGVSVGLTSRYLVADENASAVFGVDQTGGPRRLFGNLPGVDDVVQDVARSGDIYAILPGPGRLVDLTAGANVATGLRNPQGMGFDGAGNLLLAESDNGHLDLVIRTFALEAPTGVVQLGPGQPVCLGVLRAPGNAEPVRVVSASQAGYDSSPTTSNTTEVQPDPCLVASCTATVTVSGDSGLEYAQFTYRD